MNILYILYYPYVKIRDKLLAQTQWHSTYNFVTQLQYVSLFASMLHSFSFVCIIAGLEVKSSD